MEHPDRAPDGRGLPDRGDGRRRLPRGAARPAATAASSGARSTRVEPSAFARGILVVAAVHVPRRRAARGAPHAGGDLPPRPRHRAPPTSSARSTPTRSRACARRRGRSPRTPRRSTRRCSGWATSRRRRAAPWQPWLDELARRRPRRAARATAGSRPKRRAIRRRSCAAGSRRSARSSSDDPLLLGARGRGRRPAHAHRRAAGVVRPAAARAHPPLHARPAAPRDRAGHRRAVPALPRLLAARRPRAPPRRAARRGARSSRSSRASRSRPRRGRRASSRRACAATGASGSTSSRSRARSRGGGSGARAPRPIRRTPIVPRPARRPRRVDGARRAGRGSRPSREPATAARGRATRSRARGAMFLQELARADAASRATSSRTAWPS